MSDAPVWLFDLDNTLHDASHRIFPAINRQMTEYIERHLALDAEAAGQLREHYWRRYGATLLGLTRHHGIAPGHFLRETHRLDDLPALLRFHGALHATLARLPGRRIVFSNGPADYAHAVLRAMRLANAFDDVFTIERMRFTPKPDATAFRRLLHAHHLRASRCVLVEDSAANLATAKRLGMLTVWVSRELRRPPYVDVRVGSVIELARRGAGLAAGLRSTPPDQRLRRSQSAASSAK